MPKRSAFVPKAPIEKLPLAVRKDVRDNFEAKRADLETEIAGLVGFPIAIKIDVNAVWAYAAESGVTNAGSTLYYYGEGFVYALKNYVEKYGDLGKDEFKKAVSKAELTVTVNELGEEGSYISADVKDGVFRILFRPNSLGTNTGSLSEYLTAAIDKAPKEGFSLKAKHSIDSDYQEEVEDLTKEIGNILNLPDVILDPNFETNYALLLAGKQDQDWQQSFGRASLEYFQSLKTQLENQGFKGDDMLQEGFAEGVPSKTFKIRVVEKTKSYLDTVLEGGVVYLQMTPTNWYTNTYQAGSGLVELL